MRSEDDLSWGMGAGCNGIIHVHAERITQEKRRHYEKVRDCLHSGKAVTSVIKIESSHYLFLTENGHFGNWPDAPLQDIQRTVSTLHLPHFDQTTNMFIQRIEPKPRLILFGAGPDNVPLANLAADTGFSVIVTDWRPAYCTSSLFPKADQLITAFPEQMLSEFQFFRMMQLLWQPIIISTIKRSSTSYFLKTSIILDCWVRQTARNGC